jgi:7tm Chemosensory receptor
MSHHLQEFIIAQTEVLKMTGLLPYYNMPFHSLSKQQKMVSVISIGLLIGLFGSSVYFCGIYTTFVIHAIVHPHPISLDSEDGNGLLKIVKTLPFWCVAVRGLSVPIVFFIKRHSWRQLTVEVSDLLNLFKCHFSAGKIKRTSIALIVVTFCLHVVWVFTDWNDYLSGPGNLTLSSDLILPPFPKSMMHLWGFLISECFGNHLPFLLSQQIYLCAILVVVVMAEALQSVLREIQHQTLLHRSKTSHQLMKWKQIQRTRDKVQQWEDKHFKMFLLTQHVNHLFGCIFLIIFGLDVVSIIGFSSLLMNEHEKTYTMALYICAIGSVIIFGLYTTILPIPLIMLHDKVFIFKAEYAKLS